MPFVIPEKASGDNGRKPVAGKSSTICVENIENHQREGIKVFDEWLVFPSNGVAWAFHVFTKYGPVPVMLAIFIIMVPLRPHVPRTMPMHHRRALLQMGWTFRVALSFALVSVMLSPAGLISLYNSGLLTENAYNSMNTMLVLVVGLAFLAPYLLMVHVWFPRPLNWVPNRNWVISPPFRVRAWIAYMLIWVATEITFVVFGVAFDRPNASITGEEIVISAGYYLIEGMIFLVMAVYIQYRISWRNPVPGVPLAVDMALRREDLNNVQKFATFILGAGVSRCLQFLAQLFYESGPFVISAVTLGVSWIVSITSLAIACIPTWWFMRKLDPSRRLMKQLRHEVLDEKRDPKLFTLENFRNMLDYDEEELIEGSIPRPPRNHFLSLLDSPQKDILTAPGSGSSPEEVAQAFTYMSKIAERVGVGLNPEERRGLAEIRQAVRELVEHRASLNEGVASNLIPMNPGTALGPDGESGETIGLPEEQGEDGEPLDSSLANLLGQSVNSSAVGLDSQTLQEWGEFYKEKDAMERQEKAWEKQKEMQELAIKAFGFDPYAYDPYGYANPYANPYGGYPNPYEEMTPDPYAQSYADGYSYAAANPYADLYADSGYYDPYGGYGYDPYGYNAGYWQMDPQAAGAYGANPWGWPNGTPAIPSAQPYGYLDAGATNGATGDVSRNSAEAPGWAGDSGFSSQPAPATPSEAVPPDSTFSAPGAPLSPGAMGAGQVNSAGNWSAGDSRNAAFANQPGDTGVSDFGMATQPGVPMNPAMPGSAAPGAPAVPSVPAVPGTPLEPSAPMPGVSLGSDASVPTNPMNPASPAGSVSPARPDNPANPASSASPGMSEPQPVPGYPFVVRTMEGYSTVGAPASPPPLRPLVNWGQPGSQFANPQANFGQPGPQVNPGQPGSQAGTPIPGQPVPQVPNPQVNPGQPGSPIPGMPVNPSQPTSPANPGFPPTARPANAAGVNVPHPTQPYAPANVEAADEAIDPRAVYPPTFAKPRPAPRQYEEFVEDEAEIEELP